MKRLLVLATVAFAFSAMPALAAPIPHNDDDPDNWGAVYNLALCGGQPCEFTATSTDLVVTAFYEGDTHPLGECASVTRTYELVPHANVFDGIGVQMDGVCPSMVAVDLTACVYSPSGFANGSDDVELWVRDLGPTSGLGWFAKAPDDAVGTYVYRIASYEFDDQTIVTYSDPEQSFTINATYEVDGDPVLVEHDLGATSCSYPELS